MKTAGLPPYPLFGEWARRRYGFRVRKVMVDGGFTCPNRDGSRGVGGCTYCDNGAFSPMLSGSIGTQARRQLEQMQKPPGGVIVYFQPHTNTYAPVEKLRRLYRQALEVPGAVGLAVGTRPDCVDEAVVKLLDELSTCGDVFLEIGVQTAHESTLQAINRCHSWEETVAAFRKTAEHPQIHTVAHIILGLPGETREMMLQTAEMTAALRPGGLKLHHLQVVKGTRLAKEYERGDVAMLDCDEYQGLAADFIRAFDKETVLHRLVGETMGDGLVAPRWDAPKNMVIAEIVRRAREARGRAAHP